MKFIALSLTAIAMTLSTADAGDKAPAALNFKMETIDGKEVQLSEKYKGRVVLVVNVASECGLTPQYEQLQALHEKYGKKGLSVVGFPCNQFGRQEPGTSDEIKTFCKKNYGVKFDIMAKINVNGDEACPLYKHLTALDVKPKGSGKVSWNFEKFLIGADGQVKARFQPRTKPDAKEVVTAIEKELAKTDS